MKCQAFLEPRLQFIILCNNIVRSGKNCNQCHSNDWRKKLFPLFKGLVKKILVHRQYTTSTSGTDSARYCYSVWLRHLIHAHQQGFSIRDKIVAELGPGRFSGYGSCRHHLRSEAILCHGCLSILGRTAEPRHIRSPG